MKCEVRIRIIVFESKELMANPRMAMVKPVRSLTNCLIAPFVKEATARQHVRN